MLRKYKMKEKNNFKEFSKEFSTFLFSILDYSRTMKSST